MVTSYLCQFNFSDSSVGQFQPFQRQTLSRTHISFTSHPALEKAVERKCGALQIGSRIVSLNYYQVCQSCQTFYFEF